MEILYIFFDVSSHEYPFVEPWSFQTIDFIFLSSMVGISDFFYWSGHNTFNSLQSF